MREDVKDLLDRAAGWYEPPPTGPEDVAHRVRRQRRSARMIATAVALAVFVPAAALVWRGFGPDQTTLVTLAGSNVVEVPPRGEAAAAFLTDGHPVFVVHYGDGGLEVVDAFSPLRTVGVRQLAAWCPTKGYFVTWPQGAFFDRYGAWTGGREAQPGLASFAFDVIRRDATGDPTAIRVGKIGPTITGGHTNLSSIRTYPSACGLANGSNALVLTHAVDPSRVLASPAVAGTTSTSNWLAVEGTLFVSPEGPVSLCANIQGGVCRGGVPVRGVDPTGLRNEIESNPRSLYAQSHLWLVRTQNGAIVDLAIDDGR